MDLILRDLILQERIHSIHVMRDDSHRIVEGKDFKSITSKEFHLAEKINQNLYYKTFYLTKK